MAEGHRSQTDLGHLQTRAAHLAGLHDRAPVRLSQLAGDLRLHDEALGQVGLTGVGLQKHLDGHVPSWIDVARFKRRRPRRCAISPTIWSRSGTPAVE
jgi:hypothetical protein